MWWNLQQNNTLPFFLALNKHNVMLSFRAESAGFPQGSSIAIWMGRYQIHFVCQNVAMYKYAFLIFLIWWNRRSPHFQKFPALFPGSSLQQGHAMPRRTESVRHFQRQRSGWSGGALAGKFGSFIIHWKWGKYGKKTGKMIHVMVGETSKSWLFMVIS